MSKIKDEIENNRFNLMREITDYDDYRDRKDAEQYEKLNPRDGSTPWDRNPLD